ncbi:MAG: class I SAM-dependent methyltransferase [Clostridium sp.]|nr:class I SAM-dependent methyltransferase [Clostridium sp.]MCM1459200.1 class I SAM-dependent methyltransferase [Bacteroides sp.]
MPDMNITQSFYNDMASQYDKLFLGWETTMHEQAAFLSGIFRNNGFGDTSRILDCACGIGTQALGLALLGYNVTGSDISDGEITEAKRLAAEHGAEISFKQADFCNLSEAFAEQFDIVIAMDNALPHMLSSRALENAVKSIINQMGNGGMFIASIRDYDMLLKEKPTYTAPYIHKTDKGQRVSFQTWDWHGDNYNFTQYIIDDEDKLQISKFDCEYRAVRRSEFTNLLLSNGCREVTWKMPDETGFYQPIVIAKR